MATTSTRASPLIITALTKFNVTCELIRGAKEDYTGIREIHGDRGPAPGIRLDGKTAIITGCNTGIGKFNALDFCRRGCRVVMACRDTTKAKLARRDIMDELRGEQRIGDLVTRKLDLSSLKSVRGFVEEVNSEEKEINILVNNAGVMMCPKTMTEDGFEMQFGTNHLGHFLLTILLLPKILESAPARIINVTSTAYRGGTIVLDDLNWERTRYSPFKAYARSKLANVLFTRELAKRVQGSGVTVYAVHPGIVRTDLGRHMDSVMFPGFRWLYRKCFGWYVKTAREGAHTTTYCAVDVAAGRENGLYYSDCKAVDVVKRAADPDISNKLWDKSWKMVRLGDFDPFGRIIKQKK